MQDGPDPIERGPSGWHPCRCAPPGLAWPEAVRVMLLASIAAWQCVLLASGFTAEP